MRPEVRRAILDNIHYSFGCPVVQAEARLLDQLKFTTGWKNVTCKVCTALYASWPWRRIARLMLSDEERLIVVEADRRHALQDRALGIKKSFPRWLVALVPVFSCLFCPAHLFLIASFLGAGGIFGVHLAEHHTENWHVLGAIAMLVWGGLLFEAYHHRKKCHGHHHHDRH